MIFGKIIVKNCVTILIVIFNIILLVACNITDVPEVTSSAIEKPIPTVQESSIIEPQYYDDNIVAVVNGKQIFRTDYLLEKERHEEALSNLELGNFKTDNSSIDVLDKLIIIELVCQEAEDKGIIVTEEEIVVLSADIVGSLEDQTLFTEWLQKNKYTQLEFDQYLQKQLLIRKMYQLILSDIELDIEQVNARHILVESRSQAENLLDQINAGADFATLALKYSLDRSTALNGGDLGWFPRGVLTLSFLEEIAFGLEPGESSDVVESEFGFHIIQTVDRDLTRKMSHNVKILLYKRTIDKWIKNLQSQADIKKFID
ncbi:MAG TPA: hypothetical protein DCL76_01525 [Chloroflexi bacterium]|nr:hypothetical protein [Chloroflexota bacterium]